MLILYDSSDKPINVNNIVVVLQDKNPFIDTITVTVKKAIVCGVLVTV